jgi:hypothetical protein
MRENVRELGSLITAYLNFQNFRNDFRLTLKDMSKVISHKEK